MNGWLTYGEGSIALDNNQPLTSALPVQMRFTLAQTSTSVSGFKNAGFYGINIQAQNYIASFFYRPSAGAHVEGGQLKVGFRDGTGQTTYATSTIDVSNAPVNVWSNFSSTIPVPSAAPSTQNTFFVEFPAGSMGDFEFNLISCFPPTFKNRPNGIRMDLGQTFADLKPGFVRFPGGNDLEGPSIAERFIWNNTIGPLQNRPGRRGTWVGYNTEGLGILELLTFLEDIGATPVLAVYAGYSLDGKAVPQDQLQPYIDEVINELDFLIAPADTNSMGALRKHLGRAQPFDIRYVEIGNEDFFASSTYSYRWPAFYNALSQKYPNISFIATTTASIPSPPAVDDHDYQTPQFFIDNFRRYENIPRPTPKVLVGEFSVVNDRVENTLEYPTVRAAVAESIYRIGFERNSDVIIGGCYAPVLQNVFETQWLPDFISFDAGLVVRSASYLAQKIIGNNLGNIVLKSTATNSTMTHASIREGGEGDGKLGNLYFITTKRTDNNTLIVKLASVDSDDIVVNVKIQGSTTSSEGAAYILSASPGVDPSTVRNTIDNPNAVSIVTKPVSVTDGIFSITIPSWSVVVVTLAL